MFMTPPGGRRQVPLNQDFFVSFGKTVLKPEEVVLSVFIPFSRKVDATFFRKEEPLPRAETTSTPSLPAGRACPSVPTRSEEGGLFRHGDHRDESVFPGGIRRG